MSFYLLAYIILYTLCFGQDARADVVTQGNGNGRLSYYPFANISPTNVATLSVAKNIRLNDPEDQFFAQPLVYKNLVFLASVKNNIYQLDATSGNVLRSKNMGLPFNQGKDLGCLDIAVGFEGIVGTPTIDRSTDTVYFVSKSYKSGTTSGTNNGIFRLHAIDWTSWTERPNFPITLSGNNGKGITFDAESIFKGRHSIWKRTNCSLRLAQIVIFAHITVGCSRWTRPQAKYYIDMRPSTREDTAARFGKAEWDRLPEKMEAFT